MNDNFKEGKVGMAMTLAMNDVSHYADDLPMEVRQIKHAAEMKLLKYEIKDLRKTVKINKEIMASLIQESSNQKDIISRMSHQLRETNEK